MSTTRNRKVGSLVVAQRVISLIQSRHFTVNRVSQAQHQKAAPQHDDLQPVGTYSLEDRFGTATEVIVRSRP